MQQPTDHPLLIVMKGHPGTGKSTLAQALAHRLGLPLLDKDDVKDHTLHLPEGNALAYAITWQIVETQLRLGISVVADTPLSYPEDFAAQTRVALERIVRLLREAGAGPEHIVRLNWYITDRAAYFAAGAGVAAAWREVLGRQFPTSTLLFVSGLIDEQAKVEIEVTAFVPN